MLKFKEKFVAYGVLVFFLNFEIYGESLYFNGASIVVFLGFIQKNQRTSDYRLKMTIILLQLNIYTQYSF